MDIGIYTSPATLSGKLEDRDPARKCEATWNMKRLPTQLGKAPPNEVNRLFFATNGAWKGYFRLAPEILCNFSDPDAPYALIFDLNSWTEIAPVPVESFRGFRYLTGMPP
jgi:hypothetical protein